jgi:hypothetical protein
MLLVVRRDYRGWHRNMMRLFGNVSDQRLLVIYSDKILTCCHFLTLYSKSEARCPSSLLRHKISKIYFYTLIDHDPLQHTVCLYSLRLRLPPLACNSDV